MTDPRPREPEEAGVPKKTPDEMQVEAAHLLANDAKGRLEPQGFSDDQIKQWADTFLAEGNVTADVDGFVAWIERREKR